jgi:hypothetical protein
MHWHDSQRMLRCKVSGLVHGLPGLRLATPDANLKAEVSHQT